MYDHIGVRVKDLARAARFYEALLAPLGHVAGSKGEGYAGFGPQGKPAFWIHLDKRPAGCHIAFHAKDRAAVDAFHAAGVKAGGRDNGAPGLRLDYGPTYYAAFILDADGNNLEAVCMK
ncbi:MAG TPA: VOC family protein [Burkholderiales bacterium]|nr:VOC family protein [Burkholderiales bacterium]